MRFFKAFLVVSLFAAVTSCEDYLDRQPISEETSGNAYETASQIEAALTGSYESFQSSEYYVWDRLLFSDVRSDNCYAGGDNPEIFQIDFLDIDPTHSRIYTHWSNIYNAISKANLVLDRVGQVEDNLLTEERREQIRGEALFLRSYHYYTLVTLWGSVPLILEPIKSTDAESVNVAKSAEEEIYAQIIADIELAASLLPDVYGQDASVNKARATSGAAYALAAKMYAQQPNPDYAKVLEHINALEGSAADYELIDFAQLFNGNNYNNEESILEVQYLGGNEGNFGPQLLLPPSISGDAWRKFVTPSVDIVEAFDEENDVIRRDASILFESVQWVDEYWGNTQGSAVPFSYKWKNASGFASADNTYLLRYGDLVLLKAEAYNESGNLQESINEVNKIRSRVNLSNITTQEASSLGAMRDIILKERRLELFQEAQRWDDLVRYDRLVSTMNNLTEIDLRTGNPVNYPISENKRFLPIPQQELDRNPLLTQNPL